MPYLDPNSRGFLTADEIIRRAQMSREETDYLNRLSRAATEARDDAMRQYRIRAADLYMQQHHPQFAIPGSVVASEFDTRRHKGGRVRGGDYYEAPAYYPPRVVASGTPAVAPAPASNMAVMEPPMPGWTGPRTVEQIISDQRSAGVPAPSGMYPGYMPTHSGYMYVGSKPGFQEDLEYRNWLISSGVDEGDLESYGAPPTTEF